MDTLELAHNIVDLLEEKKGEDILLLDISKIAYFTDYFIICTATSDRMLKALADFVIEKVHETHDRKGHREGSAEYGWLVIDYGAIVVHLFSPDRRDYYLLEELWEQGRKLLHLQ